MTAQDTSAAPIAKAAHLALLALALALGAATPATADVTTYALPNASSTAGGISVDIEGNVYSADFGGTQLFQIAPDGSISVFATGLFTPSGNAFGNNGDLYQSNYGSNVTSDTITRIEPDGTATTFVGNLSGPVGIAIDSQSTLFVAMCDVNNVTRITQDGTTGILAQSNLFNCPNGITFDEEGLLYVVNFSDGGVLKIDEQQNVSTFATIPGGGNGHVAYVAGDLYVAARTGHQIYRVDIETAEVELLAGTGAAGRVDGEDLVAQFNLPNAVARNRAGNALFTNGVNNVVRRIELDLARPDKPKSFKAKARKRGKVNLTWKHKSFNREGFVIELSTAGSKFEEVGRVSASASKATIRDLLAGEAYRVRIRAFNGVRSSKPSKKAKFNAKD